jgi:hypothetical protein
MAEQNKIILDADVKPLKKQLREATQELQLARQKYGEFSDEAVRAAQNVAGIKAEIDAANESAQLFDPGKRFQALTTAASTAAGGIAAVQGAMALFGGESEEVEKALLKVQGAMALSQGLSQLKDVGKVGEQLKITFRGVTAGMSNFRKALIATGVGALVAGLGLLIANFETVQKVLTNMFPSLGKFASFIGRMVTAVTDFVGITNEAERSLENLAKANARSNEDIEARIKLLTAQGGKETEIYDLRKKQTNDELTLLRQTLKTKGELTDEELKRFRELKNTQIIEEVQFNKQQEEAAKSAAEKAEAEREKQNAKRLEAQKILDDARIKMLDDQEQQIATIEQNYREKRKKLAEAGIKDDGTLEQARLMQIKAVNDKFKKEEEDKEKEFQTQLNDIRTAIRLEGIKDVNEKARQQILLDFEKQRQDVLNNEKLTSDQKLALQLELTQQEQQQLNSLQFTIDQANAEKAITKLDAEMKEAQASFQIQRDLVDQKDALIREQFKNGLINEEQFNESLKGLSLARIEIDKNEAAAKMDNASKIAGILGGLSNIVGKETQAGKGFAVASATIDTYLSAQKAYQSMVGIPVAGPALAAVAAGVAIAGGIKNVREITRTKIPGIGDGVSAPNISASAPAITSAVPTLGTSPVTALGTMMQNQPPLRAYVVESEVTGSQRRVADIERRAGF